FGEMVEREMLRMLQIPTPAGAAYEEQIVMDFFSSLREKTKLNLVQKLRASLAGLRLAVPASPPNPTNTAPTATSFGIHPKAKPPKSILDGGATFSSPATPARVIIGSPTSPQPSVPEQADPDPRINTPPDPAAPVFAEHFSIFGPSDP